jgi:serine/threonine protein kinase
VASVPGEALGRERSFDLNDADRESPLPAHKVADVGRYRLIAELARGGMGIVFLALVAGPGGFNKLFCVKVLKGAMAEDRKLVSMFLEEARLAAKLNHPNVVQTIEVGSDDGQHFIAMEYLEGQSLYGIQSRGRRAENPFPLSYHVYVLVHLLEGLEYAHTATDFDGTPLHLVHRDVSPHNVFVTYDGRVKILDFGIAKALGSSNDTNTGMLKGKVAYMAPEQAAGEPLDGRADVFAAGVMLWDAVVGQRMWNRSLNDLQILHALMKGAIPDPREAKPDIDPRLERIILHATAVNAEDRYETAAEMQRDLEAYLDDPGTASFGARDIGSSSPSSAS